MTAEFEDTVAVVTGAASGIGAAVVRQLAAGGASVVTADIAPTAGGSVVDVSDPDSVAAFADSFARQHSRCDLLVNCAGTTAVGTATECRVDDWDRVFAVNTRGVWLMCCALIPLMPSGAAIVNVASGAGLRPIANMAAYVASKTATVGLSKAMALDHATAGIRVNCVCPGLVDTPLAAHTQQHRPPTAKQAVANFDGYLIKRMASAEEIAETICFLGSARATYLTGAAIAVDGGRTLH